MLSFHLIPLWEPVPWAARIYDLDMTDLCNCRGCVLRTVMVLTFAWYTEVANCPKSCINVHPWRLSRCGYTKPRLTESGVSSMSAGRRSWTWDFPGPLSASVSVTLGDPGFRLARHGWKQRCELWVSVLGTPTLGLVRISILKLNLNKQN